MNQTGRGAGNAPTAWYVVPSDRYLARWWNVLHAPYTLWHLSYVVLGAGLGDQVRWDVLGWAVLAFFLGLGVAGHAFDLLRGDPLALRLPARHLAVVGAVSLLLAALIGVLNVLWGNVPWQVAPLIVAGIAIALGYNLEWPGFHGDPQFALFWGKFPFLVGFLAMDGGPAPAAVLGGGFCLLTAWAQRVLSARTRYLRRRVADVFLSLDEWEADANAAGPRPDAMRWLLTPLDQALALLSFAMPALAGSVLLWRWS